MSSVSRISKESSSNKGNKQVKVNNSSSEDQDRDANCSFFAVFSTFFKLQILVILSKMPQNTFFFFKDHFMHTSMETKWKILFLKPTYFFSSSKILFSFVRGWHLCQDANYVDEIIWLYFMTFDTFKKFCCNTEFCYLAFTVRAPVFGPPNFLYRIIYYWM